MEETGREGSIENELNLLEIELPCIIDAIADGQPHKPLVARNKAEEEREKALSRELKILNL